MLLIKYRSKSLREQCLNTESILVKFITATAKARAATLKIIMDIYIEFSVKERYKRTMRKLTWCQNVHKWFVAKKCN